MNILVSLVLVVCTTKAMVDAVTVEMTTPQFPGVKKYVEEGERVVLQCTHESAQDTTASTLQFDFNDKPLVYDKHDIKSTTGVVQQRTMFLQVEIAAAKFSDAGVYTCKEKAGSDNNFKFHLYVYRVNKDDVEVGENSTEAVLRCSVQNSPGNSNFGNERPGRVAWFKKDGLGYSRVNEVEGRIAISDYLDSLNISDIDITSYEDVGEYRCQVLPDAGARTINYTININTAAAIIPFKAESTKGIQGDAKDLACAAYGFPKPKIVWRHEGKPVVFNDRIMADPGVMGIMNSTISFTTLEEEDHGLYQCTATNSLGSGEAEITLRVKDRYAALWPFLGICAEVAILCAVIFFFEKRRARKMREEEEDPACGDGLINHREEELRQRKVQA